MMLINAVLMGGIAAAAAPIIVHIAHRRKATAMDWGAMRFLEEMLVKSRRRLFIEQWLLLAVRSLVLLTLALALTRPALEPEVELGSLKRYGHVAAVILIDDSASTGAGRLRPAMDAMQEMANAYIDTLGDRDEISVIKLSHLGMPTADPMFDHEAAKTLVNESRPTDAASNIPTLLQAGLVQLEKHHNPEAEIVLITDGSGEGWRFDERPLWAEIRRDLRSRDNAKEGGPRARLLVLETGQELSSDNIAITSLSLDRALIPTGHEVSVRVGLRCGSGRKVDGARLRLLVDGRTVDERALELASEGVHELTFVHTFQEPGSHVVEASIEAMKDSFEKDDKRALSVDVADKLPVLLIEGAGGTGLNGSLGLLSVALDPDKNGEDIFDVDRISVSNMSGVRLNDYRAIVLGDVPALEATAVAAIERFVVRGGGVLIGLGPQTDSEIANRFWARSGDGFMPSPLAEVVDLEERDVPTVVSPSHPALRAFIGQAGEAWKTARIQKYWRLDTEPVPPEELTRILTMSNGDPLLVDRSRGYGHITMLTTSLDLSWSEFAVRPAYVPLVRGIIEYLGSAVLPPRNLRPSDRLTHVADAGVEIPAAEGPDGHFVPLERGGWEGRSAFTSAPLTWGGVYRIYEGARKVPTFYVVSLDPSESSFEKTEVEERDKALAGLDGAILAGVTELRNALDPAGRENVELWRLFVMASLAMLFTETFLTRRQAMVEGRIHSRGRLAVRGGQA